MTARTDEAAARAVLSREPSNVAAAAAAAIVCISYFHFPLPLLTIFTRRRVSLTCSKMGS